jgi:hypothetical protein
MEDIGPVDNETCGVYETAVLQTARAIRTADQMEISQSYNGGINFEACISALQLAG